MRTLGKPPLYPWSGEAPPSPEKAARFPPWSRPYSTPPTRSQGRAAWRASRPSSRLARLRLWLRRGRWLVAPERERRRSGASPHHSLGRILGLIALRREMLPLNVFTGHATDYAVKFYRLSKRHSPCGVGKRIVRVPNVGRAAPANVGLQDEIPLGFLPEQSALHCSLCQPWKG